MDPTLQVVSLAVAIALASVIWLVQLRRSRRPHTNPPDAKHVKMGDMSVAYWQLRFDNLQGSLERIERALETISSKL